MNVGYKHTAYNYKSSTASGLIVSKGPLFPQKHHPAKFSDYVLVKCNQIEGKPVVHLDETWANARDGKTKAWVETETTTKGTIGGVQGML